MSIQRMFASAVLGAAMGIQGGCTSQPEVPPSAPQEANLTPEHAKDALLEMTRSKPGKELGWFNGDISDQMAKMTIEEEEEGWYAWTGAFRFNPSKAIYTFTVRPRPGARACLFEYRGSFVHKDGRWLATPPQLLRTALQAGGDP